MIREATSSLSAKEGGQPLKLHRFWDGAVSTTDDTRDVHELAIELRAENPRPQLDPHSDKVAPSDFANWVEESGNLLATTFIATAS